MIQTHNGAWLGYREVDVAQTLKALNLNLAERPDDMDSSYLVATG